jgi:alpha-tubulin suppressor-like RCC1 family protein
MRRRRLTIGLAVLALILVVAGLRFGKSNGFPVEIRCQRIITQPHVTGTWNAALILAPDGTVWGWGPNSGGLLGPINSRGKWNLPRRLDVGTNWVSLAVGVSHAVGTKLDGTLWGWTYNPYKGTKSIGTYTNPPTQLAPGTNWIAVAAGAGHSLALRADGSIWAWGQNDNGQVGNGTFYSWPPAPERVGTNQNWTAVAAGASLPLACKPTVRSGNGDVPFSVPTSLPTVICSRPRALVPAATGSQYSPAISVTSRASATAVFRFGVQMRNNFSVTHTRHFLDRWKSTPTVSCSCFQTQMSSLCNGTANYSEPVMPDALPRIPWDWLSVAIGLPSGRALGPISV